VEVSQNPLQQRDIADRTERLGTLKRQRAKTLAASGREDYDLQI
jgi:hypothetical protein